MSKTKKGRVKVNGDGRSEVNSRDKVNDIKIGSNKLKDDKVEDKDVGDNEVTKNENLWKTYKFKKMISFSHFFNAKARLAFTKLRKLFIKASIFYHFNLERHIQIKMDTSGYVIGGVLNHLTLDHLGQWHLVAFFS